MQLGSIDFFFWKDGYYILSGGYSLRLTLCLFLCLNLAENYYWLWFASQFSNSTREILLIAVATKDLWIMEGSLWYLIWIQMRMFGYKAVSADAYVLQSFCKDGID